LDYDGILVKEIVIDALYSCGGMVTYLCLGIEIDDFLHVDAVLRLFPLAYSVLIPILEMLLDSCVLVGLMVLATW
jgi:hypothetical protein